MRLRPELTFTRVLNGFSAGVDARAVAVLEREPGVEATYPVRAAYPASVSSSTLASPGFGPGSGHRPEISLPGFDGLGVTIALLDTGVDLAHPYLGGRLLEGIDLVAGDELAGAESSPVDRTEIEAHGTEMAGIVVGAGGPGGLGGVAPGAAILPIRVAGWQQDAMGRWAVFARTDQLVAGLERAVDPNGDGDAHDGARIALVPLAEPFAAFSDGPLARAAAGALRLDTLVVTAAGNDGPAGPSFGSISGPGGAPAALTVGAADLRREGQAVRLVVRRGLSVQLDRAVPLVGAVAPEGPLNLELAAPRKDRRQPASLADFFDRRGYKSRRRPRRARPGRGRARARRRERCASRRLRCAPLRWPARGRRAWGERGRPGTGRRCLARGRAPRSVHIRACSGLDGLDRGGAQRAQRRRRAGRSLLIAGPLVRRAREPDLVSLGVSVTTAVPGSNDDGTQRYGTVNGSSAAAAAVAGAAALLVQARPSLDAVAVKSLLVGSARPLPGDPLAAQGAGLVDVGAAAAAELATEPASLSFGRASNDGQTTRTLLLRNVSTRRLIVDVSPHVAGEEQATVGLAATPSRIELPQGATSSVTLALRLTKAPRADAAGGTVVLTPFGGAPVRVPWAATLRSGGYGLIGGLQLSAPSFRPSDTAPAVLALRAGRVASSPDGEEVQPVFRLNLELWTAGGRRLGVLARLRDLLPGRYVFGLTGRGPRGGILKPGTYRLRLVAFPAGGGASSRAWDSLCDHGRCQVIH